MAYSWGDVRTCAFALRRPTDLATMWTITEHFDQSASVTQVSTHKVGPGKNQSQRYPEIQIKDIDDMMDDDCLLVVLKPSHYFFI